MRTSVALQQRAALIIETCRGLLKRRRELDVSLGKYLLEFKQKGFQTMYGYTSFDAWLASKKFLDISLSEVRMLVSLVQLGEGVPVETLERIPRSVAPAVIRRAKTLTSKEDRRTLFEIAATETATKTLTTIRQIEGDSIPEFDERFTVFDSGSAKLINQAFRRVKGEQGVRDNISALVRICHVYLTMTR